VTLQAWIERIEYHETIEALEEWAPSLLALCKGDLTRGVDGQDGATRTVSMPTETPAARIARSMTRAAERMDDAQLAAELARVRRCALCMTRSRRELARLQIRCLECELERRSGPR
jgi:hypothetical protein